MTYNADLQTKNARIQALIDRANALPDAGGGGAPEDLSAVLAEQEQLIATLQETLRGKAAGDGGGADDAPKYVKIFARPESTATFTIENPLGGIAKQVSACRIVTTTTSNRKICKYIANSDYDIGAVETISTGGIVRYTVVQAPDDTPENAQFAMLDGVIKLKQYNSANTWDTDSEYEVEIYQSDADYSDTLSMIKEKVIGYDIMAGEV